MNGHLLGHAHRDMRTPYPTWRAQHPDAEHGGVTDETVATLGNGGTVVLHSCPCGATYREITEA